jgi:protein-S-isoprenylcysteine O-methyltransferase Ste14
MTHSPSSAPIVAKDPVSFSDQLLAAMSSWRVRAAVLLVGVEVAEEVMVGQEPLDLLSPSVLVVLALSLIAIGATFRLAALGCIRKNEEVETVGVYSMCRHPLYLGSLLLLAGFLILMNDWPLFAVALTYFTVFYAAAIIREERFLSQKFPEAYARFRESTPALIPVGQFRRGRFSLARAMRRGGVPLFAAIITLLVGIEALGKFAHH